MTVLVVIVITDLVPIQESATWRSYVNVAATTGRSLGGPVGGWLADAIGWRWSVSPYTTLTSFCGGHAVINNRDIRTGHSVFKYLYCSLQLFFAGKVCPTLYQDKVWKV